MHRPSQQSPSHWKGVRRASVCDMETAIFGEPEPKWSSTTHGATFRTNPSDIVFEVPRNHWKEVSGLQPSFEDDPKDGMLVYFPKVTKESKHIYGIKNKFGMSTGGANWKWAKARQLRVFKVEKVARKELLRVLIVLHRDAKLDPKIRAHMDRHFTKVHTPIAVRANKNKGQTRLEVTDDTTIQTQIDYPSASLRSSTVMPVAEWVNSTPSKSSGHNTRSTSSSVSSVSSTGAIGARADSRSSNANM